MFGYLPFELSVGIATQCVDGKTLTHCKCG